MKAEIGQLKSQLVDVGELQAEVHQLKAKITCADEMFPSLLPTAGHTVNGVDARGPKLPETRLSYVGLAHSLQSATNAFQNELPRQRQQQTKIRHPPVIGSSTSNSAVKSASTQKYIDVFVSRLHPSTTNAEIQECVNIIKGDDFITHEIECEKLKARYEHLYASFRVKIKVNSSDMKRALELFMANSSWPNGIFVRRYFPPKEQDGK